MSLTRAFTKRPRRSTNVAEESDTQAVPGRSCTVRYTPGTISRTKISLPTELISTTNMHALNAPDIRKITAGTVKVNTSSGAGSSANSSSDSISERSDGEFSTINKSFLLDIGTSSPSSSSIDGGSSPMTPMTPPLMSDSEIRDFFSSKSPSAAAAVVDTMPQAPSVPQRAPSHSKKAHVELSRQRSISRLSPPPNALPSMDSPASAPSSKQAARTSAEIFAPHPFGRELAQVDEVAEEFGAVVNSNSTAAGMLDDEEREMVSKGLCKFTVRDYLCEIMPLNLHGGVLEGRLGVNPWI